MLSFTKFTLNYFWKVSDKNFFNLFTSFPNSSFFWSKINFFFIWKKSQFLYQFFYLKICFRIFFVSLNGTSLDTCQIGLSCPFWNFSCFLLITTFFIPFLCKQSNTCDTIVDLSSNTPLYLYSNGGKKWIGFPLSGFLHSFLKWNWYDFFLWTFLRIFL